MTIPHLLAMLFLLLSLPSCENTDVSTAVDAGLDAVKAVTLSDQEVREIASQSARYADDKHTLAPVGGTYDQRLRGLVGQRFQDGDLQFNYAVYLSPEVNAFAMADGTIRIHSALMDLLDDGELRFVIGHEMGHVVKRHIRKQIQLAYAARAVRKGLASQNNAAGEIARSFFGGFAETLMNAQFSQLEEKEADDYGLAFLQREKFAPRAAVTALNKIALLAPGHSFLSSHPDPAKRAKRLLDQVEGRAVSMEEKKENLLARFKTLVLARLPFFHKEGEGGW
jgi:putative metalloprotease